MSGFHSVFTTGNKKKSVSHKKTKTSLAREKEPDLVRLSTRSPGREGMPAKIPAVQAGAGAGASRGKIGGCGREEGYGRKEGAAAPLEVVQALLLVVEFSAIVPLHRDLGKELPANSILPNKVSPFRLCGQITLTRSVIFSVRCLI